MKKILSEQLPNDGRYVWHELVNKANERLGQIGKHGKRAKIKVTPKPGNPISAQFSLKGKQQNPGLNLSLNKNNLIKAEEICTLITSQLIAGTFTQDWLDSLLGKNKKPTEKEKVLTCGEMLEQYKVHYFKQRKNDKSPINNWSGHYRHTEKTLIQHYDKQINLKIVREIIDRTENNTVSRANTLNGLANFLKYFDNNDFKQVIKHYKRENNPKPEKKYIPNDTEILNTYKFGFNFKPNCPHKWRYRHYQWQFLYALLATYGLRIHEAWNIKNWDSPVTLKHGDWMAIADDMEGTDNEDEEGRYIYEQWKGELTFIPAILDPENQDYLLCIGHETKTGYRVAFPISPSGHSRECSWIKEFNLVQPLNLPDLTNPLEYSSSGEGSRKCTKVTGGWFRERKYGFTAHALRHAYNIRGHKLGINQKILANSLGHSLQMNSNNYLKHEGDISKIQGIKQAIHEDTFKRSELERAKEEIAVLKAEVEKLRTKLAMYEAIKDKT